MLKKKIEHITKEYLRLSKDEMVLFREGIEEQIKQIKDRFGRVKGADILKRKLGEFPESLFIILMSRLSPDEMAEFKSQEIQRWFFKKFREFRITEQI